MPSFRFKINLAKSNLNDKQRLAYTQRGLTPPFGESWSRKPWFFDRARLHDPLDREWHYRYATRHGYFWLACPQCWNGMGGHEPMDDSGTCSFCATGQSRA